MGYKFIMCSWKDKMICVIIKMGKQKITLLLWQNCDTNKMSRMCKQFEQAINKIRAGKDQLKK